jgi:hypothetical protein
MHKEVPFTGPSKPLRQAPKKTAVASTGSGDSGGGVHGQRCQFEGVGEAVEEAHGSRVQTGSVLLRGCHLAAPHGTSPSWPCPGRPKDAMMGAAAAAAVVACEGVQVRIGFGRGARIVGSRGGDVGWDGGRARMWSGRGGILVTPSRMQLWDPCHTYNFE